MDLDEDIIPILADRGKVRGKDIVNVLASTVYKQKWDLFNEVLFVGELGERDLDTIRGLS